MKRSVPRLALSVCLLLGLYVLITVGRARAQPLPPLAGAPAPPPPAPVTTEEGSFGTDIELQDITYTVRHSWMRAITVSPHDPNVAYVASWDGYVWKTTDGGRTWEESRLITEIRPFYGDAGERRYFGRHRVAGEGELSFEGDPLAYEPKFLSFQPTFNYDTSAFTGFSASGFTSPGLESGLSTTLKKTIGRHTPSRSLEVSSEAEAEQMAMGRGASANVNFGIGLPGGSPRLQLLVRKLGKPTSGVNIKQTLLYVGTLPTEVRIVVVHPNDPNVVFACTAFGLYKSYDAGINWVRTFTGTSPKGRFAFHVAVDPSNDRKVLLATGEGVYISRDGGENFMKTTKQGVGEGVMNWVYFNPYDPRYVFVGTDYGLFRSADGGESWDYIYFTTFPDGRVVRSIVIDPFDKKTGYIATHDGLFTTPDILTAGLDSWKRLGGLQLTGVETSKIAACPRHKGHLWTLTNLKLNKPDQPGKHDTGGAFIYETVDGGESWRVIFAGHTTGSMQWFDNDPRDPDLLWIAWSRAMHKMVRRRPGAKEHKKKVVIPDDPPIGEVIMAALAYTGVEPGRQLRYRALSRLRALMPSIHLDFNTVQLSGYGLMHQGGYQYLPYRARLVDAYYPQEFRFMLMWDLSDLVFNLEASFFGRISRINGEFWGYLLNGIHRYYGELRRLRALMANGLPKDRRLRLMYRLRIEELTSYLDMITGGYLTRWKRGDRPQGIDTKWWVPWKNKKR